VVAFCSDSYDLADQRLVGRTPAGTLGVGVAGVTDSDPAFLHGGVAARGRSRVHVGVVGAPWGAR
jgi:hypothetical protein